MGCGDLIHRNNGDLFSRLESKSALEGDRGDWGRGGSLRRGAGVAELIIHVPMHLATVVGEARQVMEHLPAVLTLVDLVPAVGLDVRPQVVSPSIALATDVAGERLFSSVNAHVSPQVCGPNEAVAAHLTHERALRLPPLLSTGLRLKLDHLLLVDLKVRVHEVDELHGGVRRTAVEDLYG